MKQNVLEEFKNKKPIFGMLHLKGDNDADVLERAKKEIDIYMNCGIDAVIVENYFGNYYQMEQILQYIVDHRPNLTFGINCLKNDAMGFSLAKRFHPLFLQFDSVSGHLKPRDDVTYKAFIDEYRKDNEVYILGGVRFKYQPYLSMRTLEEDLKIAMTRCDAIVVTQDATGQETSMDKIKEFREILGDFPLIVGAGLTVENCSEQFKVADGAIVGSYFKDTYKDTGEVEEDHVKVLLEAVRNIE